jgi:sugar phosphate isomerase/epimerase
MTHFRCKARLWLWLLLVPVGGGMASAACRPVPADKIALQLYSVARLAQPRSGQDPAATLTGLFKTLHEIGYRNVERFGGTLGVAPDAYRAAAHAAQIGIIGSHDPLDAETWERYLTEAAAFGQRYVGSAGFGPPGLDTLEHVLATARNLNARGRAAAAHGLHLYVHNHQAEFETRYRYDIDGNARPRPVSAWEIVAANTDPALVSFEIDVHWARRAFGLERFDDLLAFLRKYAARIVMLHVKETAADGSITDLGRGTTDWARLFDAAGEGVRYYIWEYDDPPDPLASARIAYRYLRCARP